jgi:chromosome segregation ATPase
VSEAVVLALIGVIGSGGLLGSVVALMRARPEGERIAAETSEISVRAASAVVKDLREDLDAVRAEAESCHGEREELLERVKSCESKINRRDRLIGTLETKLNRREDTIGKLTERIESLEAAQGA